VPDAQMHRAKQLDQIRYKQYVTRLRKVEEDIEDAAAALASGSAGE
jgi:hypothetical protein